MKTNQIDEYREFCGADILQLVTEDVVHGYKKRTLIPYYHIW